MSAQWHMSTEAYTAGRYTTTSNRGADGREAGEVIPRGYQSRRDSDHHNTDEVRTERAEDGNSYAATAADGQTGDVGWWEQTLGRPDPGQRQVQSCLSY